MSWRRVAALGALALVVSASAGAWTTTRDRGPTPSRRAADRPCEFPYVVPRTVPAHPERLPALHSVQRVADGATTIAFAPDGTGLVAERTGRVYPLGGGPPVLDLSDDTQDEGDGGLLGLAFAPDGERLYVYRANAQRDEVVTAYPVVDGTPDRDGERVIIEIEHPPSLQHHGGGFAFGPDGYLYIGTGDGGGLGDPNGNGQRLSTLLGKILRIDPTPAQTEPYRVPDDNPFAGQSGTRPEIWAYGLRNPFRLSFDTETGDLWIGDVGQSCWEELNHLPAGAGSAGANLGWDRREGTHRFEGGRLDAAVDPVHTYSHRGGRCAVVAGYMYHRAGSPYDGTLLYTDYCGGRLRALDYTPGEPPNVLDLAVRLVRPTAIVPDPAGEPIVLTLDGGVLRLELP